VGADDDGTAVSREQLPAGFDELASSGASAGVRIAYENTPFSHHIKTTEQAVDFVTEVGNRNGGLILDIWHAFRGGSSHDDIARITPPEYVFGVELDDGSAEVVCTDLEDTFDNRLPCGQGVFGVPAFINAVRSIGYAGPWALSTCRTSSGNYPSSRRLRRLGTPRWPASKPPPSQLGQTTSRRVAHRGPLGSAAFEPVDE
jgi:sugar phosphate isomerase/epimerase